MLWRASAKNFDFHARDQGRTAAPKIRGVPHRSLLSAASRMLRASRAPMPSPRVRPAQPVLAVSRSGCGGSEFVGILRETHLVDDIQ